jgi:cobalt/nickel transport system permease protein
MIAEPFAVGNSTIHRLDPRIRVFLATVYSFVVALSTGFPALIAALFLAVALTVVAGLNLREVVRRIAIVNGLIVLLWIALPLTFAGEPLYRIGRVSLSRPGVMFAAQITLKSNAIFLGLMALIATMSFAVLGHALNRMRVPQKIVHLLLMTYRYVFVLEEEYQRLARAIKIRGFRPGTNFNTYRTYAYVVGMLFVRAASRAERVRRAMVCRGFKGRFYCLQEYRTDRTGRIFSALMLLIIIGLVVMQIKG